MKGKRDFCEINFGILGFSADIKISNRTNIKYQSNSNIRISLPFISNIKISLLIFANITYQPASGIKISAKRGLSIKISAQKGANIEYQKPPSPPSINGPKVGGWGGGHDPLDSYGRSAPAPL